VDNLRIDNLVIDTYSDGINLDCCRNVRISGTTINTPNADAIVLKSSYALSEAHATENVTIDNCMGCPGQVIGGAGRFACRDGRRRRAEQLSSAGGS
jgi:polygalacturonase